MEVSYVVAERGSEVGVLALPLQIERKRIIGSRDDMPAPLVASSVGSVRMYNART